MLNILVVIAQFFIYASVFFTVGTIFYDSFFASKQASIVWPNRLFITASALLAMSFSLVHYSLQAARLTGDVASMVDAEMLSLLWQTPIGNGFMIRMAGLVLLLLGVGINARCSAQRQGQCIVVVGAIVCLASFSQIGHIFGLGAWWFQGVLLLHLCGIALWVGVLWPLLMLSKDNHNTIITWQVAHKFGQWAALFVPILLIAGVWLAFLLVGSFYNLLFSTYGQILLAKVLLVSGLLALAAFNKLRLVPLLENNNLQALQRFRCVVRAEISLVLAAFLLTAVLTSVTGLP